MSDTRRQPLLMAGFDNGRNQVELLRLIPPSGQGMRQTGQQEWEALRARRS